MRVPNEITHSHVLQYIRGIVPYMEDRSSFVEKQCQIEDVPMVDPEVKTLIGFLLSLRPPKRILEIGTAYGFSAIYMSQFLKLGGSILSIERHEVMWRQAEINIERAGLTNVIDLRKGQAAEILPALTEPYDFILLDASVAQYSYFFAQAKRLLNPQGVIVADNVLHGGMVARERLTVPRRQRTIHSRMQKFLYEALRDPELVTSLQPIGDGVLLAYKKEVMEDICE